MIGRHPSALLAFCALLLASPLVASAQTSQEMDAEAEKAAADIVARDMPTVQHELRNRISAGKARKLLVVDPYNPELLSAFTDYHVTASIVSGEDFPTAAYLKAIELAPGNWLHHANFARFLHNHGYVAEADKYYARAIELSPSMLLLLWRGHAAFQGRDYPHCVASLTQAAAMPPQPVYEEWTYAYLSLCQAQLGDKAASAASLKKAVELGGDAVTNHLMVRSGAWSQPVQCGRDADKAGNRYRATEGKSPEKRYVALVQWATCFPDDKAAHLEGEDLAWEIPDLRQDWWRYHGVRATGQISSPLDQLDTAGDTKFYLKNTLPYMWRMLAAGEFEKALEHTATIPVEFPGLAEHFYVRALMFLEMPEYRLLAWREANQLLRLNANSPTARAIRARVYYEVKGNPERALAEIAEGFRHVLPERTPDLYFARGRVHYGEGRFAEALADFEAALKVNPAYPQAAFYRDLAANPQVDAGAAMAMRDRDAKVRHQLDQIATAVNIAMSWLRTNGDRARNQTEACDAVAKAKRDLSVEQGRLRALAPSVPQAGPLREYFHKAVAAVETNLGTVASGSASCPS